MKIQFMVILPSDSKIMTTKYSILNILCKSSLLSLSPVSEPSQLSFNDPRGIVCCAL